MAASRGGWVRLRSYYLSDADLQALADRARQLRNATGDKDPVGVGA